MDDIVRTKAGRWEKAAYGASIGFAGLALLGSELLKTAGVGSFWLRLVLVLLLGALGFALLIRPANRQTRARLAADLDNGVFDCAIRFPTAAPGTLSDMWNPGAAQVTADSLAFQPQQGVYQPQPTGRKSTFDHPVVLGPAERTRKKPPGWGRDWSIRELQTDNGKIHIAAGPAGLALMEDQFVREAS